MAETSKAQGVTESMTKIGREWDDHNNKEIKLKILGLKDEERTTLNRMVWQQVLENIVDNLIFNIIKQHNLVIDIQLDDTKNINWPAVAHHAKPWCYGNLLSGWRNTNICWNVRHCEGMCLHGDWRLYTIRKQWRQNNLKILPEQLGCRCWVWSNHCGRNRNETSRTMLVGDFLIFLIVNHAFLIYEHSDPGV